MRSWRSTPGGRECMLGGGFHPIRTSLRHPPTLWPGRLNARGRAQDEAFGRSIYGGSEDSGTSDAGGRSPRQARQGRRTAASKPGEDDFTSGTYSRRWTRSVGRNREWETLYSSGDCSKISIIASSSRRRGGPMDGGST